MSIEDGTPAIPRTLDQPPKPNPFTNPAPWTRRERIKLVLLFPIMLIRGFLIFVIVLLTALLAGIATLGAPMRTIAGTSYHTDPFSECRLALLKPVAFGIRVVLFLLGFWEIKITKGPESSRVNPAEVYRSTAVEHRPRIIVAAPHVTEIDCLILYWAWFRMLPSVGDSIIKKVPLISCLGIACQSIFVNLRSNEGREACKEAIEMRADPSWIGPPLLVFPEGRITNGKSLIQFKTGAFQPGCPVQPVLLRYPSKHYDLTGQSATNKGVYSWPFRVMTQFYNRCEVELLDVYEPSGAERLNPIRFANGVRDVMAEKLGVHTTEHSYEDAAFFTKAQALHIVPDREVKTISADYDLDMGNLQSLLSAFARADQDSDGFINEQDFRKLMRGGLHDIFDLRDQARLSRFSPSKQVFMFFDRDNDGQLNFFEFVQAMSLLHKGSVDLDRTKLAFAILCKVEDDIVEKGVLREVLMNSGTTCDREDVLQYLPEKIPYDAFINLASRHHEIVLYALQHGNPRSTSFMPGLRDANPAEALLGVFRATH